MTVFLLLLKQINNFNLIGAGFHPAQDLVGDLNPDAMEPRSNITKTQAETIGPRRSKAHPEMKGLVRRTR